MQQAVTRRASYLTPDQVAARYEGRISVRTLANWRFLGNGPAFSRLGGRVLYPEDKLLEWEAKNTVNSTSEYKK
jgi:hypothetical protein